MKLLEISFDNIGIFEKGFNFDLIAREKQLKIVPTCSYVDTMFKRDQSLVDVAA